ncbi:hypothetical protein N7537_003990 [Penicillium hordei]|uniref:Uncharacterized protein n=1 Tax=Penicillium hordei TaxID=40994 RepID=A0AAD6EAP8_9EURO|nr:uncharacterized protein N7537_003990 [Penicillium hordei]KAJ5607371.1 hypothetical protein N7537_003990 [Penicillium hordei]
MYGSLHVPRIPAKALAIFDADSNSGPSDCKKAELNGYGNNILGQEHTRWNFETPLKHQGTEPGNSSDLYGGKLGAFTPVEQQQQDIYTRSHEVSCLPLELAHVQSVLTDMNQCPLAPGAGEQANYYTGLF